MNARAIATVFVCLAVVFAGCTGMNGGTGGDSADDGAAGDTTTAPSDATTTSSDGGTTTQSATVHTTTSADESTTGGDGTTTQSATAEDESTATDQPADTSTPAQGGEDTTIETSASGTQTTTSGGGFSLQEHSTAVQSVGSYTINYTIAGSFGGDSRSSTNMIIQGTQKVDVSSGEYYSTTESGSTIIEYYSPPSSQTVYQHFGSHTRQTTRNQTSLFNFSSLGAATSAEDLSNLRSVGTVQTSVGPATKYVADSIKQLSESTRNQYYNIESVSIVVLVDQDTGIITKYELQITYVQKGQEMTFSLVIEVLDLGSTTIKTPDWVPEEK